MLPSPPSAMGMVCIWVCGFIFNMASLAIAQNSIELILSLKESGMIKTL